jgi:hypothetical protein
LLSAAAGEVLEIVGGTRNAWGRNASKQFRVYLWSRAT